MRHYSARNLQGQALPMMALFAVLIFALVGFAIDGGLLYMQRRLMQNTADAACLTAANRVALKQESAAMSAAQAVIQQNLGSPTPGANSVNAPGTLAYTNINQVYASNGTSGANLTQGIEISGSDVRVALQSPANTFFMRVVGITQYTVAARAHCGATAGGGGTPFAVARWRGFDDRDDQIDGPTTAKNLPQTTKQGKKNVYMRVRDVLQAGSTNDGICCGYDSSNASAGSTNWLWETAGEVALPGNPDTYTGIYRQASPVASKSNPGYETVIAGKGAKPNIGDNSFTGPIVLDFRNVSSSPEFFYPIDGSTSLQQYKDLLSQYILNGYNGPFVPAGTEVGYFSGISAGQIYDAFKARYKVGDIVNVLVYNGTTYQKESFTMGLTGSDTVTRDKPDSSDSPFPPKCTIDANAYIYDGSGANPAEYSLSVTPDSGGSTTYKMRAFLSDNGTAWSKAQGRWNGGSWTSFDSNGFGFSGSISLSSGNMTFDLRQSDTALCVRVTPLPAVLMLPQRSTGAQTIYLEAQDSANSKRRGRYMLLEMDDADKDDFFAYFPGEIIYSPLEPGQQASAQLAIETVDGNSVTVDKLDSGYPQFDWFDTSKSSLGSGATKDCVTVELNKQGQRNNLDISIADESSCSAPNNNKEYYLRISLKYKGETHYAWYYIKVQPPLSNSSSINSYVYILGYAEFQITDIQNNYIKAQAVSGLLTREEDLTSGLQPRLLPW
jgi:Flp pilus assembly protein TadG